MSMKITTKEWDSITSDYKSDIDGQKYMLYYLPRYGTCLIPVSLDDDEGLGFGIYHFEESGVKHSVYAYSMADALRKILHCDHHYIPSITGLRRGKPYQSGEQVKIIDGYIVYVKGCWYDISDPDGGESRFSGFCEPGTTPRAVYRLHFPPCQRDGMPVEKATLFFLDHTIRFDAWVETAILVPCERYELVEGYALTYKLCGSEKETCVEWNSRPRIIAANDFVDLPPHNRSVPAAKYLDAATDYLLSKGIGWQEL